MSLDTFPPLFLAFLLCHLGKQEVTRGCCSCRLGAPSYTQCVSSGQGLGGKPGRAEKKGAGFGGGEGPAPRRPGGH